MNSSGSVFGTQSFPSIDPRVGWALTILCLVIGLLIICGVLRINVGPLSSWVWIQIVAAQALTALIVGGAAHLSSRGKAAPEATSVKDASVEDQTSA